MAAPPDGQAVAAAAGELGWGEARDRRLQNGRAHGAGDAGRGDCPAEG